VSRLEVCSRGACAVPVFCAKHFLIVFWRAPPAGRPWHGGWAGGGVGVGQLVYVVVSAACIGRLLCVLKLEQLYRGGVQLKNRSTLFKKSITNLIFFRYFCL
jgi:hypothetical protein